MQLTGGHREKGERSARFEVDAYNRRQAGRIDDDEFRMRTTDQAAAKALELVVMLPVVHAKSVFTQVDDQLHRAIRKTAFPGVLLILAFVQPEHMHEGRERRLGNVGAMNCQRRPPMLAFVTTPHGSSRRVLRRGLIRPLVLRHHNGCKFEVSITALRTSIIVPNKTGIVKQMFNMGFSDACAFY